MKGQKQTQLSCNTASKCHRQFETVLQVRTDFSQENFGTSNKLTEIFTCTSTIQVACDSLIQHDKCWEILQKLCFKTLDNHYDVSQTVKMLNKCCTVKPLWYRRQREGVECLYYGGVHITVRVLKEGCAWNSRMSWEAQSAKCKQQSCTVLTKKLPWQWCSTGWD